MNSARSTDATHETRGQAPGSQATSRLLVISLAASLLLHAWVLWILPEWERAAEMAPAPVIDVLLLSGATEAPQPAASTETAPVEIARPVIPPPREQRPRRPAPPPRLVMPEPALLVDTVPLAPATPATAQEPVASAGPPATGARRAPAPTVQPLTPPSLSAAYLRNPPPHYPPLARRKGDAGRVTLKVLVSAAGVPVQVEVDQSSGSAPLDNAALDAVRTWRFVPARRGTQNVEAWVQVPVVFRLDS